VTQRHDLEAGRIAPAILPVAVALAATLAVPALAADPPRRALKQAAQAPAVETVRINPDLEICEVRGAFEVGQPPRRVEALVFNPRTDLVYTALDAAADPDAASRVVEGPARDRAVRACADFAQRNRNSAAAQAYQRSVQRADQLMKAERARAQGQPVPLGAAAAPPPATRAAALPSPTREDTGPSAAAVLAATRAPAQAQPPAAAVGPAERGQTTDQDRALRTQHLDILLPGIILPSALTQQAEDEINERLRRGVEEALLRSPDIDAARREITAANHLYQAAIRDRLNPEIQFETLGGMSQGRRGPALQTSDDLDPATGQRTQSTNAGVRGFVRPGVTVSLPVYDAGERDAKKSIAGIEVETSNLSLDDRRAETASIMRQMFYEWRVSRAYIGLVQQWRPLFDDWIGRIRKLERAQFATFQDLMLANAVDEHFRERMDAICLDLELREKIWEQTIGQKSLRLPSDKSALWCEMPKGSKALPPEAKVPALDDVTMSHWPVLPAYPSDPQLDAMIERTPAVQTAVNDVRKQREKLQVAESQMMPRLFAEAHARRTMPGFENTTGDSDNFVGMRFAMPLFDNFVRSSRAQAEQAAIGAAESRLIGVREKLRRDLRLFTAELARLGNLQRSQFETVRAAAIRLKNAKYRFEELGSKEQKELMLANLDYLRTFERSDDTIRQYFAVYNRLLRALGIAGADWAEG
jgi:outer membrane protein TolC